MNVLDKGWIELQDLMGSDEELCKVARVSYAREDVQNIPRLIDHLIKSGHMTIFEFAEFKFKVYAPELVFRQWVRHRIGEFNVQSRRRSAVAIDDLYFPQSWRTHDPEDDFELTYQLDKFYGEACDNYESALGRGVPKELARVFLPGYSVYSWFIWKVNGSSLMNFLKKRLAPSAQFEIREYANVIYTEFFEPALPHTAKAFEKYILKV